MLLLLTLATTLALNPLQITVVWLVALLQIIEMRKCWWCFVETPTGALYRSTERLLWHSPSHSLLRAGLLA